MAKPRATSKPTLATTSAKSHTRSKIFAHSRPTSSDFQAQLRQAVKDLGGDDEDLDLIAEVDDDEDEVAVDSGKTKTNSKDDEKSLRKALADFMKGLDFDKVAPVATEEEDEEGDYKDEEDEDEDEDEEQSEDVEDDDDEDEIEHEEEDEEDEKDIKEEKQVFVPTPKAKNETPVPAISPAKSKKPEEDKTSGKNIPAEPIWYNLVPALSDPASPLPRPNPTQLSNLRQRGTQLLQSLPALPRSSSSDATFISQILSSGTHQDRLSALVLLVRESPIHAVKELEKLRGMAGWKDGAPSGTGGGGREERVAVMRALADWWVSGGGKETGKLRYFADQPLLTHPELTDRHLVVFAFEDFLKKWFFNILQILEVMSHDTLPYVRTQALNIIFQLLSGNAEQEQNLLRLGVNKLGDTDRSVASKTSHLLLQLLQTHPAMKSVVAREVSALVLKTTASGAATVSGHVRFDNEDKKPDTKGKMAGRKNDATSHGRYYGLITLNQMTLTSKDRDVAGRLVELYFEVFRELLGDEIRKGEEGGQKEEDEDEGVKVEQVEKIVGKVEKWRGRRKGAKPKGGRKTALENEELVESGDAKLVAAVLTGVNRALPFAKLDEELFAGYMETLFKITHAGTFNTSIQALTLIFQVSQSRESVSGRFYRTLYESLNDSRLVTSSKQAMYLNLLFKALKADKSLPRVMAFVKRLLQVLTMYQPPFICGALYLLGELFNTTPGLKRMLIEPEDDGDEHFVDAPEDGEEIVLAESSRAAIGKQYDGKKRDPLYANADSSCLWELVPFLKHFHPSVSLQANQLLLSQPLSGSPDISLNSLISFLDKFVYRNPKKTLQPRGASIMQPAAASDKSGMVVKNKGARTGSDGYLVNSEEFWKKKIEDVPVDQMFFHKFFAIKLARKEAVAKKKGKKDDDLENVDESGDDVDEQDVEEGDDDLDEDEDEDNEKEGDENLDVSDEDDPEEAEIWKAMKASIPSAGDDLGLSDISDSDDFDEAEADYDESDEEAEDGAEQEEEDEEDEDEGADDSDASSDFPDFGDEDEDDLIPLDQVPDIVLNADASDDEEDDEELDEAGKKKRKRKEDRKERKKKRKEMPVFGSYEDYAALIDGADSEDVD